MPVESLEEFGNRWRDRALEAELEIQRLRAELSDWQHNLALRAFTAPDADLATILASLDSRIRDALAASSAPADQNLRDRIAEALAASDGWQFAADFRLTDMSARTVADYRHNADAVLAVLPVLADRAAVLREAADVLDTLPADATCFDEAEHKYKGGAAAERLHRMADEAQQAPECGAELTPRTGTRPCILPASHDGSHHQDQHTNRWPVEQQAGESRG